MAKSILSVVYTVLEDRFFYLLATLLGYLLFAPFLQGFLHLRLLYYLFMTVILLASIFAVRTSKKQTVIAVTLGVAMFPLIWIAFVHPSKTLSLSAYSVSLLFLSYIIILILRSIFNTPKVTRHVIFGAISVYLLIGISWSTLYAILETLYPGSFSQTPESASSHPDFYVYFSFVNITTLGYGDITPLTAKAQSLVIGEAIIGQIYMTVLIAWLVGLYVSRKVSQPPNQRK